MTDQFRPSAPVADRRSDRALAKAGASQGMGVLSYLLGGMGVYGALGWLGWHYLGQLWMMPVGIMVGIGLAILLSIRRFARGDVIDADIKRMLAERDRKQQYWMAEARRSG